MSIKHLSIVFFLRRNYTWGTVRQFTRIWMVTILHCNLSLYIRTACISHISACIFPPSLSLNGKKSSLLTEPQTCISQESILIKWSKIEDIHICICKKHLRTFSTCKGYICIRVGNEHWDIPTLMSTTGFYFHNFCELDSTKNRNKHLESAVPLQ